MAYKKLFTVNVIHRYFEPGKKGPFSLVPSQACLKSLRRFALLFRCYDNGFTVYYKQESDDSDLPCRPIDEPVVFTFYIFSNDPFLFSYSDIPFFKPGKHLLVFNNLNKKGRKNTKLSLATASSNLASTADMVILERGGFYKQNLAQSESIELCDESGNHHTDCMAIDGRQLKIDLSQKRPGLFTVKNEKGKISAFYFDQNISAQKPVGVIRLHVSAKVMPSYQFTEAKQLNTTDQVLPVKPKEFEIQFGSRSTIWRYYLISRLGTGIDRNNLVIKNENNDLKLKSPKSQEEKIKTVSFFKNPQPATFNNGDQAIVFVSDQPIPMRKKAYKNIELNIVDGIQEQPVIEHLPNPEVSEISFKGIDRLNNKENATSDPGHVEIPFSNIFVYY